MSEVLSKTQVDKLGERLKAGEPSEDDLRTLDAYRRTFGKAYEYVVGVIREQLKLEPTGRPAKSTGAIREKLQRESIRLSQMQDIAGCRIIVADIAAQNSAVERIVTAFPGAATIVDRRENPSHGYRAVHVVVHHDAMLVEVQCRTELQHLWSQLSERLADIIDPGIKYGSGPAAEQGMLTMFSSAIENIEKQELSGEQVVAGRPLKPQLGEWLQRLLDKL